MCNCHSHLHSWPSNFRIYRWPTHLLEVRQQVGRYSRRCHRWSLGFYKYQYRSGCGLRWRWFDCGGYCRQKWERTQLPTDRVRHCSLFVCAIDRFPRSVLRSLPACPLELIDHNTHRERLLPFEFWACWTLGVTCHRRQRE